MLIQAHLFSRVLYIYFIFLQTYIFQTHIFRCPHILLEFSYCGQHLHPLFLVLFGVTGVLEPFPASSGEMQKYTPDSLPVQHRASSTFSSVNLDSVMKKYFMVWDARFFFPFSKRQQMLGNVVRWTITVDIKLRLMLVYITTDNLCLYLSLAHTHVNCVTGWLSTPEVWGSGHRICPNKAVEAGSKECA